jgi:hypothetical protein
MKQRAATYSDAGALSVIWFPHSIKHNTHEAGRRRLVNGHKFQTETPPNFVRIHQTPKISPAMAAGVTDKLWEMSDMVKVLENWEARS